MTTGDQNYQNAWFSRGASSGLTEHFAEIRTYAYLVFDSLDSNGNGFIELDELSAALEAPEYSEREKSFVTFLLNNHAAMSDASEQGGSKGVSRKDIEAYFKIIEALL